MGLRVGTGSSWGWYRADLGACRDITRCRNKSVKVYIYIFIYLFTYIHIYICVCVCTHIGLGLNPKQRGSHELTGHSLYPPDLKHLPSVK